MLQILDTSMGLPKPSLNVVIYYFSNSCLRISSNSELSLKMYKKDVKRKLDATFVYCLALNVIEQAAKRPHIWHFIYSDVVCKVMMFAKKAILRYFQIGV